MGRLFGTDGVRGVANETLTCELAMEIGRAAAMVLSDNARRRPIFVVGTDTRISSGMLSGALTAGLCSVGADVVRLGVVPTPAVAYLVGKYKADAGVMISASHSGYEYNGIKIFSGDGYKLPDDLEEQIESIILDKAAAPRLGMGNDVGMVVDKQGTAVKDYVDHLKSTIPNALTGISVAVDCANGAASATARQLFTELGADCRLLFDSPDGHNINEGCGSTNMRALIDYVRENRMDIGIAFDGDADRCLAVDGEGSVVDGDFIMAIMALDMMKRGKLAKNTVVGTIMTNMGFGDFCEANGIRFVPTKVGDRYVLEEMLMQGYCFGGEQSGHIIFLEYATTGDGQLTAIQLLCLLKREGITLAEAAKVMRRYPQVMVNVKVSQEGKTRFYLDPDVKAAVEWGKSEMGKDGRVVVRVSGTESVIRVMAEGMDSQKIESVANRIAGVVRDRLA